MCWPWRALAQADILPHPALGSVPGHRGCSASPWRQQGHGLCVQVDGPALACPDSPRSQGTPSWPPSACALGRTLAQPTASQPSCAGAARFIGCNRSPAWPRPSLPSSPCWCPPGALPKATPVVVGKCPRSDPRWGLWVMQAPLHGDGPHVMAQHTKTKKCEAAHRKVLAAACPGSLSRLLPDPPAWRGRETFPREAVAQRTEDRRWPQATTRAEVPVTATQEDGGSAREGGWRSGLDLQRNWGAVRIGVTPLGLSRGRVPASELDV